jgi:type IV secretion system protein TrbL
VEIWLALKTLKSRKANSMTTRRRSKWIGLGSAALLFFALPVFAQTDPQGILQDYATASTNWQSAIAPYAYNLFKLLAAVDFAWTCIVVALEKQDMQGVVATIIKKLMTIGVFWILLAYAPQWFPLIIQSFVQVGGAGSGQVTPLNPSSILSKGISIAGYLFNGASASNLLLSPATSLALILAGLGIVLSYLVITIHFIMAMVESYIVIGAGYIFLGFGGSRWTSTYVERYVSLVISIGARLMVLYLVIGVGQTFATQWITEAQSAATGAAADISAAWNLMCQVVIYGIVCWIVPKLTGNVIGGTLSVSGGDAIGVGVAAATAAFSGAALASGIGAPATAAVGATGAVAGAASAAGAASKAGSVAKAANTVGAAGRMATNAAAYNGGGAASSALRTNAGANPLSAAGPITQVPPPPTSTRSGPSSPAAPAAVGRSVVQPPPPASILRPSSSTGGGTAVQQTLQKGRALIEGTHGKLPPDGSTISGPGLSISHSPE